MIKMIIIIDDVDDDDDDDDDNDDDNDDDDSLFGITIRKSSDHTYGNGSTKSN